MLFCVICRTGIRRSYLQRHLLATLSLIINKKKKKKKKEKHSKYFCKHLLGILIGFLSAVQFTEHQLTTPKLISSYLKLEID